MIANFYTGSGLDRAGWLRRDAQGLAARLNDPTTRLVPVWRGQSPVLRATGSAAAVFPSVAEAPDLAGRADMALFLGLEGDTAWFALDFSSLSDPAVLGLSGAFLMLRVLGRALPGAEAARLAYARGLVHWHATQVYCGRCGGPTETREGGHMRRCLDEKCKALHFPRSDPAVIMLVTCGDRCLLGRQAQWPKGMFSTLAGFVEPGESMEEAVIREVFEETGIDVFAVRYHSSQPWPFPSSMMVGFYAEAAEAVEPRIDGLELESARWFTRQEVRDFPQSGLLPPGADSVARRLLEDWLAEG